MNCQVGSFFKKKLFFQKPSLLCSFSGDKTTVHMYVSEYVSAFLVTVFICFFLPFLPFSLHVCPQRNRNCSTHTNSSCLLVFLGSSFSYDLGIFSSVLPPLNSVFIFRFNFFGFFTPIITFTILLLNPS